VISISLNLQTTTLQIFQLYSFLLSKFINLSRSLTLLLPLFVLIFSTSLNTICAQQHDQAISIDPTVKFQIGAGAIIYSSDEEFNKQVLSKKILSGNIEIRQQEKSDPKKVLMITGKVSPGQNNKHSQKLSENKLQKGVREKREKEISKSLQKIKQFSVPNHFSTPVSDQFSSYSAGSKNYINPGQSNNPFSNAYILNNAYQIKRALDYLHANQYLNYNNKSIDFCFTEIFSVRPPPYFLLFLNGKAT